MPEGNSWRQAVTAREERKRKVSEWRERTATEDPPANAAIADWIKAAGEYRRFAARHPDPAIVEVNKHAAVQALSHAREWKYAIGNPENEGQAIKQRRAARP